MTAPLPRWMDQAIAGVDAEDVDTFLDGLLQGIDPDCTWRVAARQTSLPRALEGHDGVRRFFRHMFERSGGTFRVEMYEVLASDSPLAIFLRATAQTPDGPVDTRVAHFATLGPRGMASNWFLPSYVANHDRLLV